MLDARLWIFDAVGALVAPAGGIHSTFGPEDPFPAERPVVVIRCGLITREIPGAASQEVQIWVHDEPGTYKNIDSILSTLRAGLDGVQITEADGVQAVWQGDSGDLADDARKTVVRNASYRLVGRR